MHETENLVEVLPALHKNSEEFCIIPSDGTLTQCVEAFLETIIEDIIPEDGCNLMKSEEVASEVIAEGEREERGVNKSSESSTI